MPTMSDIGVAKPSAHGQAIIKTETAVDTANAKRGSGPKNIQTRKVIAAIATTAGTKIEATRSASR